MTQISVMVPTASIIAHSVDDPFRIVVMESGPKHGGKYILPGGCVDIGERTMQTAERELLEETGLTGTHFSFFFLEDAPKRDVRTHSLQRYAGDSWPADMQDIPVTAYFCMDAVYTCEVEGEPFPADGEAAQVFYMDAREVKEEDFAVGHGAYVKKYVEMVENAKK